MSLSGEVDNPSASGGSGAPTDATYITQTANASLSNEQALGSLDTGLVKNTTTTGVLSIAAQGTDYYAPGGTDVAVTDGGTGSSTAAGALTNLGLTASAAELNYTDGVTSAIQTQLDAKQPLDSDLTTIAGLTATSDNFIQSKSSAWASRTPAQVVIDLLPFVYPVGCLYFSTNGTNPATSLGFGTWSAFGAGRVPVGFDSGNTFFDTDEEVGGSATHTHALTNVRTLMSNPTGRMAFRRSTNPSGEWTATHEVTGTSGTNTGNLTSAAELSGTPDATNAMPPYIVVRMWKRTA